MTKAFGSILPQPITNTAATAFQSVQPFSVGGAFATITGCTLALAAGTWVLSAQADFTGGVGATNDEIRIQDTTNAVSVAGAEDSIAAGQPVTIAIVPVVYILAAPATVALQAGNNGAAASATTNQVLQTGAGTTEKPTFITALRVS